MPRHDKNEIKNIRFAALKDSVPIPWDSVLALAATGTFFMAEKLKSFYFKHDENAANDIKLMAVRSQLAMEGYGIYWFLLEQLSMAGGRMKLKMIPMLATIMGTTPDKALSVVKNYELFVVDEDGFFSERLNRELEKRGTLSEAGRVAGLKSAEIRKIKQLEPTVVERLSNDRSTTVQPEEKRIEENRIQEDRKEEIHTSTGVDKKDDIETRKLNFKKIVNDAGGLTYKKWFLDEFIGYWSEPNDNKKPKLRWESAAKKGWDLSRRLKTFEANKKGFLLTESQKTIKQKQNNFADSLQPFKDSEKYSKETLNAFYRHWSQPENKSEPQYIRWEMETFWDLGQRLSTWKASPLNKGKDEEKVFYKIPE